MSKTLLALGEIESGIREYKSAQSLYDRALIIDKKCSQASYQVTLYQRDYSSLEVCKLNRLDGYEQEVYLTSLLKQAKYLEQKNDLIGSVLILDQVLKANPSHAGAGEDIDRILKTLFLFLLKQNAGGFSFKSYSRSISKVFEIAVTRPRLFRPKEIISPLLSLIKTHPYVEQL